MVLDHPPWASLNTLHRVLALPHGEGLRDRQVPFLHVSPQNTRALSLYGQNGWRKRVELPFWSLG